MRWISGEMMEIISHLSNIIIPFLLLYVIGSGLLSGRDIYSDFLEGARDGLKTVWKIVPTLIGLMVAVGVLRASGFLDFLSAWAGKLTVKIGMPAELVPLALVKMFSSSAATGLLLDIFKESGTDSSVGMMAAVMLCATESVFYCMSIYFGSVKIRNTRYTLPGAILASAAGIAASVMIVSLM